MIYAVAKQNSLREYLESVISDEKITYLQDEADVFNQSFQNTDILLLSLESVEVDYRDYFNYIKKIVNDVHIIAITNEPKVTQGAFFLKLGFRSYLNCFATKAVYQQVLTTVKKGNIWTYPELTAYLISKIDIESHDEHDARIDTLTPKELEVAYLATDGLTNKQIAASMDLQEITVKKYISSIFHKLDVKDRIGLVLYIKKYSK